MNDEKATLLDQLAMAALTGLLANPDYLKSAALIAQQKGRLLNEEVAAAAYGIAMSLKFERERVMKIEGDCYVA
jgi:hypothetical protein